MYIHIYVDIPRVLLRYNQARRVILRGGRIASKGRRSVYSRYILTRYIVGSRDSLASSALSTLTTALRRTRSSLVHHKTHVRYLYLGRMKLSALFIHCWALAMLMLAGEAIARRALVHAYVGAPNYYYNTAQTETPRYNTQVQTTSTARPPGADTAVRRVYQKYVACVARSFLFEGCSLCFCSDVPNVAICWEYTGETCTLMRRLYYEQKDAKNNDPNGIW